MKTTNLKWIAYALSALMLIQSCGVSQKTSLSENEADTSNTSSAQHIKKKSNVFVRVYDLQNRKICKGKIISVSETTLELYRNGKFISIPAITIGKIKTKRSIGHSILSGAVIAGGPILIAGIASDFAQENSFNSGEPYFYIGLFATIGALIGGLVGLAKNIKSIEVNGDLLKWKTIKVNWDTSQKMMKK
jgi:hypothetical protein